MSELLVLTRPELLPGYRLAGVEAYAAPDAAAAEAHLHRWLESGRGGLAAVDEKILADVRPEILNRLRKSRQLFHIAIPGAAAEESDTERDQRLAAMIRRAIGFHISFGGSDEEPAI